MFIRSSYQKISTTTFIYHFEGVKKDIDSFSDRISNYESNQANETRENLSALIDALERTVNECYNSGANIAGYVSGSIAYSPNVIDLYKCTCIAHKFVQDNIDKITSAGKNQKAAFEQMQKA